MNQKRKPNYFGITHKKKLPKSFSFFPICHNCAQKGGQFDMVCADKLQQEWEKTSVEKDRERNANLPKCQPTPRKLLSNVDGMLCPGADPNANIMSMKCGGALPTNRQLATHPKGMTSHGLGWHIIWIHTAHLSQER